MPFLIREGIDDAPSLASHFGFHIRQANYYRAATEALGLVKTEFGKYLLTDAGGRYVKQIPIDRNAYVTKRLLQNRVLNEVLDLARHRKGVGVTDSDIARIILARTELSGSTPKRRASSVRSYFKWMGQTSGIVVVNDRKIFSREGWERSRGSSPL